MAGKLLEKKIQQLFCLEKLFDFVDRLACVTPVVGANAGGVRTIIEHGETGMLCEEKNVAQFTEAVTYLLSNDSIRASMGEEGYRYGQAQSWEAIFHQLLDSYREVLQPEEFELDNLARVILKSFSDMQGFFS